MSREETEPIGEKGYYQDPLQGVHQSLTFMGRRPLFILKDEWETAPPTREDSYYQAIDPRTELYMEITKKKALELQPVGLVQWKVPRTGPGLNFVKSKEGEKEPEPDYTVKLAMMNADAVGLGGDEEEELDVVSSDDEEGMQLRKGKGKEDDMLTVYYPLISRPNKSRGKELRGVLEAIADEAGGATARIAKEWLDEIERVDKIPSIHDRE